MNLPNRDTETAAIIRNAKREALTAAALAIATMSVEGDCSTIRWAMVRRCREIVLALIAALEPKPCRHKFYHVAYNPFDPGDTTIWCNDCPAVRRLSEWKMETANAKA